MMSPPSQGAWIEILFSAPASMDILSPSPPSQGAWIEIAVGHETQCYRYVAPLAGGVD